MTREKFQLCKFVFPKFNPSSLLNSGLNLKFDFFLNVKFIKLGLLKISCKYLTFLQSYAQKTLGGVGSTPPRPGRIKELRKEIPSYVHVRGWNAFVRCNCQPQIYRVCSLAGHFGKDCPRNNKKSGDQQQKPPEGQSTENPGKSQLICLKEKPPPRILSLQNLQLHRQRS